ncbi:MAG: tyrosine-type recombinase/integrase [Methanoregula sp.]
MSNHLDKLPQLDETNAEILKGYIRKQELKQLQPASIRDKLWRVYYLLKFLSWKDARQINKSDFEDYIISRRKTVSPRTLQGDMIELKIFFRFIDPEKEKEFFPADEKMEKPKIKYEPPLSRDDIQKVVRACDTLRDRALIMFLWDTGCRVSEALDLNVGNIHIDQSCGNTRLRGKTGDREAWLIDCLPDLQAWINVHPHNKDPDAPLFITYTRYGFGARRLNIRTVQNLCKTLQKRAGVSERVHPHAFRHARATDKAKDGYTEMELRIMFGWTPSSNMPAIYIHLSGADVKQKILQKAGLVEQVTPAGERPLDTVKCPRCGILNTGDSIYCKSCSMGLKDEVRRRMMSMQQGVKSSSDYKQIKGQMNN